MKLYIVRKLIDNGDGTSHFIYPRSYGGGLPYGVTRNIANSIRPCWSPGAARSIAHTMHIRRGGAWEVIEREVEL